MARRKREPVTPADQLAEAMAVIAGTFAVGLVGIVTGPSAGTDPMSYAARVRDEQARRKAALTTPGEADVQAIRAWASAPPARRAR